jgi:hypothetical protein
VTELTQEHPLHVVVARLGNSAHIAARHYLTVTDADFDRAASPGGKPGAFSGAVAVQNAVQQQCAGNSRESQETKKSPENKGFSSLVANHCGSVQTYLVPPRGVEPLFSD